MENTFRDSAPQDLELIETFAWRPGEGAEKGAVRLKLHLSRMERSAAVFDLPFDYDAALAAIRVRGSEALRCRLSLGARGFGFQATPLGPPPTRDWKLGIAVQRLDKVDPWLRHKTTQRALYDEIRAGLSDQLDEMLFQNQDGEMCEGTITNLFVQRSDGAFVTPPLASGLLPGILRQTLLTEGPWREGVLTRRDLEHARRLWVGNSLRGLIPAQLG